jgi:hypothetical protein
MESERTPQRLQADAVLLPSAVDCCEGAEEVDTEFSLHAPELPLADVSGAGRFRRPEPSSAAERTGGFDSLPTLSAAL